MTGHSILHDDGVMYASKTKDDLISEIYSLKEHTRILNHELNTAIRALDDIASIIERYAIGDE